MYDARVIRAAAAACTAAALNVPAGAYAQSPPGARAFCLPGAAESCLAFAITDEPTGFDVWLRALTASSTPSFSPFTIREFSLGRNNAPAADAGRTDLVAGFSNANVNVTDAAVRGRDGINQFNSPADWPAFRWFDFSMRPGLGVVGCAVPGGASMDAGFFVALTCPERGADGWLRVSFRPAVLTEVPGSAGIERRQATSADVAVSVAGCVTHLGAASGVAGPFRGAVACASTPFDATVVPEPAVVWLVAAGAAALAGRAALKAGR
jgi:hypothetical protein